MNISGKGKNEQAIIANLFKMHHVQIEWNMEVFLDGNDQHFANSHWLILHQVVLLNDPLFWQDFHYTKGTKAIIIAFNLPAKHLFFSEGVQLQTVND